MDFPDITSVLAKAAADANTAAEYNRDKQPTMRPSRAGLPLIQLVLEDLLIPKLPKITGNQPQWKTKADPFASVMRLANGYLFEKAVEQELLSIYEGTNAQVLTQEQLTLDGMVGSCDMLVVNHATKLALVIECKALKAYSVSEVKQQKLLCDNWGYLTQLVLYTIAVQQKYPDYEVIPWWYVWMKPLERHTKVALTYTQAEMQQIYSDVLTKAQQYQEFKDNFSAGKLSYGVHKLLHNTVELPHKIQAEGYMKGSCSLHFDPYAQLFTKADGTLADNAEDIVLLLTKAAYYGSGSDAEQALLSLLQPTNV